MVKYSFLCVLITLVGCSDRNNDTVRIDGLNVGAIDAASFGEVKRIPERAKSRRDEAFEAFQARTEIASFLLSEHFSDDDAIRVEMQELVNNLVLTKYLKGRAEEEITAEKIEDYYRANVDEFSEREYEVAHILFRVFPNAGASTVENAEAKAQAIYARLLAGEDFFSLVSEQSEAQGDGGQVRTLKSINLDKSLEYQLSKLAPGDFTKPIRTDRGIQIFKLQSVQSDSVPLEQVADKIRYALRQDIEKKELERLRVQARANKIQ